MQLTDILAVWMMRHKAGRLPVAMLPGQIANLTWRQAVYEDNDMSLLLLISKDVSKEELWKP